MKIHEIARVCNGVVFGGLVRTCCPVTVFLYRKRADQSPVFERIGDEEKKVV